MSDTREIPLTQGKVAIVDADMYNELAQYKWYSNNGYAARTVRDGGGHHYYVFMHRVVNNTPDGLYTDHIDGDPGNNTRENLRTATRSQNSRNRSAWGRSRFLGVHFHKGHNGWQARISSHGNRVHLGYFISEEDAARAYNDAAVRLHGEFARLNDVPAPIGEDHHAE